MTLTPQSQAVLARCRFGSVDGPELEPIIRKLLLLVEKQREALSYCVFLINESRCTSTRGRSVIPKQALAHADEVMRKMGEA